MNTTTPAEFYYRETTGSSNAAVVAQGADKPESNPVWTQFTATVEKIAHYVRVNDEVIADFTGFLTTVGQSLIAGLIDARNERLLNGTQALTTTGIQVHAVGADTKLDALFLAGNLLRTGTSFTEPDTIILNPADYGDMRVVKDSEGRYLTGDPAAAGPPMIFGTRVLVTNKIAAGTGLVANLAEAGRLYVREAPRVDVNPMGGAAEFIANQTLLRAEERFALAIVKPTAIVKVTGL